MKVSELAIRRPVLTWMFVLAFVVFGFISYRSIGVGYFPEVDMPIVTVMVRYEGQNPDTVETEVTDVIENAVKAISGIKVMRSTSYEGLSMVIIEFELDEDIDVVAQEVRDKVSKIRGDLPRGIDAPIIEKLDLDSGAVLTLLVSGDNKSIAEITTYADDVVREQIEGTPGVGAVRLVGQREREIRIWLHADQLQAYEITPNDVTDAIERANVDLPGGRIETGAMEMTVKMSGKMETVEEFEKIPILHRDTTSIFLSDVATIEDGLEDQRSLTRYDGGLAVSLLVRRQSGRNMVSMARSVKEELVEIQEGAEEQGFQVDVVQDISIFVEQSVDEATGELLRGGILAVLVIFIFLRSVRGSFVAAVTIPTTIIATLAFMLMFGFTLNMLTLLALTISVGMIVDDSIVVLENSYRHMEAGKNRIQAAIAGMQEIGFAVVATSLAIAVVFIPVAFMDGIIGQFFYEFGLTVTFAVIISTCIAVTLSPMLCSRVLRVSKQHGILFRGVERVLKGIEGAYRAVLTIALKQRWAVMLLGAAAIGSGVFVMQFLGGEFAPNPDESQFNVQIKTPVGSSLDTTREIVDDVERRMRSLPGVQHTFVTIGANEQEEVNRALITVKMAPKSDRDYSQFDVMDMARESLAEFDHLDLSVEIVPRFEGGGFKNVAIQLNIRGSDLDEMAEVSTSILDEMKERGGYVDLATSYDAGEPRVLPRLDRDKASELGISSRDVSEAVNTMIGGRVVTTYEEDGETFDVRVRLREQDRDRPEEILNIPIRTMSGECVELRSISSIEEEMGMVQIDREDGERQITIFANLEQTKKLAAAQAEIEGIIAGIDLPPGVSTKFTGEVELMEDSFANIAFSMLLAVILIYMVLAAQFESLIHPFTIMLTLPLSLIGALGLLALTGRTLNIFSLIGMIMLMGLVTKNAILLIDYANQLRREKGLNAKQAMLGAGPVRLRPILMTAISTMAGMTPVVFGLGEGAETRAPMGTAIVGGLVTSTVLTLLIIPVVYTLIDDVSRFVKRIFRFIFGEPEHLENEVEVASTDSPFDAP